MASSTATALGLVRERLNSRLSDPGSYSIGWIVAPAGSGKSRLLDQLAESWPGPVAWCGSMESLPRTEGGLVDALAGALAAAGVSTTVSNYPPEDVASLLSQVPAQGPLLVVLDDVHVLEGSEAEDALAALISQLPPAWRLVMASRVNLGFDLYRLRVSGLVVDIGPDDLRFRTWEVEELFRDVYNQPMLPEDVATLTRRTSGWAAYLQLFFLATGHRPESERRRVLGSLHNRTRLVSEYLARHVLAGLEAELQDFLVRTSVLRQPSARLCDELLPAVGDSARMLEELERRQLFTYRIDDEHFRYHPVLLAYLRAKMVETLGLDGARTEHRRAGELLERDGQVADALAAYARAEDWVGMGRVLGLGVAEAGVLDDGWMDALPPDVVESDPLLLMVKARTALARGSLSEAATDLRRAEGIAVSSSVKELCRGRRHQVLTWLDVDRAPAEDWVGMLRRATISSPEEARRRAATLPGVAARFTEAMAAYLAGDLASAVRTLRVVVAHSDASAFLVAAAKTLELLAVPRLGRRPTLEQVLALKEEVELSGVRWLDRVAAILLVNDDRLRRDSLDHLMSACEQADDRWGAALIACIAGVTGIAGVAGVADIAGVAESGAGDMAAGSLLIEDSAKRFSALRADVLAAWCISFAALTAIGSGQTDAALGYARKALALGSARDVPGVVGAAMLVIGTITEDKDQVASARRILEPFGTWEWHARQVDPERIAAERIAASAGPSLAEAAVSAPAAVRPAAVRPAVVIRCLGDFAMEVGGDPVDESSAKPMERAVLHLLCASAGRPVHREEIIAALWPDAGVDVGLHRLQVAVSALRRLVGRDGLPGARLIVRSGSSYQLALPAGALVDVREMERLVGEAAVSRAAGDSAKERGLLSEAVDLYKGPLFPSDGPAEWVVEPRRIAAAAFVDAACRLATLCLEAADVDAALRASRAGLAADRYRDDLWMVLIEATARAGNQAAAEQVRREYEAMLAELGL